MEFIDSSDINRVRKKIKSFKELGKKVVVLAKDDFFNRKIFENKDVDLVVGLEFHNRKDFLKQRDSGLNEVLCKLAKQNNISLGFDMNKFKSLNQDDLAKVLARVIQNIKLCEKFGVDMLIVGNYNKQDVLSFFLTLGSSTGFAKHCVS